MPRHARRLRGQRDVPRHHRMRRRFEGDQAGRRLRQGHGGKDHGVPRVEDASAIVIAWDEDDYAGYAGCCNSPTGADGGLLGGAKAPALVITSKNPKAQTSTDPYNHYSLLATI